MSEDDIPTSFIMDTNKGGIPITICSCGVLMMKSMARGHYETCPAFLAAQATFRAARAEPDPHS